MNEHRAIRAASRIKGKQKIFVTAAVTAAVVTALHLGAPVTNVSAAMDPVDRNITESTKAMRPASFAELIEAVKPAVVSIATSGRLLQGRQWQMPDLELPPGSPFEKFFDEHFKRQRSKGPADAEMHALGSGFIVDPDGYIVTNHHVVANAEEITVILEDGTRHGAEVIGTDARTDLALLKIENDEPLPYVRFGESDKTKVGDWVVAVGNPFGLGGSASAGIISARGRNIQSGPYDDYLQIDAPINRGNSGGPLFDTTGKVIGVNTAIFSPSGGNVGVGFAIPSAMAESVIDELKSNGRVERGWLGVHIQEVTEELAQGFGLEEEHGALVSSVEKDSPAKRAGLQPGDVIIEFDGKGVEAMRELPRIVAVTDEGDEVRVRVWRDGEKKSLKVTMGKLPGDEMVAATDSEDADDGTPKLGLTLSSLSKETKQRYDLSENEVGVLIVDVDSDGPAARQGVKAGDIIKRVGRKTVSTPSEVVAEVKRSAEKEDGSVLLLIKRGGIDRFVAISLESA